MTIGTGGEETGCQDLESVGLELARIEAEVALMAEHCGDLGLEELLERLARVRRGLVGVATTLLRAQFVTAVREPPGDLRAVLYVLDHLGRLPGSLSGSGSPREGSQ